MLYFVDPVDEYTIQTLPEFEGKKFQNVAKEGLEFGDEGENAKEKLKELQESYKPLTDWLKDQALSDVIEKAVVSNRLVDSPCALVASQYGWYVVCVCCGCCVLCVLWRLGCCVVGAWVLCVWWVLGCCVCGGCLGVVCVVGAWVLCVWWVLGCCVCCGCLGVVCEVGAWVLCVLWVLGCCVCGCSVCISCEVCFLSAPSGPATWRGSCVHRHTQLAKTPTPS